MKLNSLKSKDSKFYKFIRIFLLMIFMLPITAIVTLFWWEANNLNVNKVMYLFFTIFLSKFSEYMMKEIAEIEFLWFEECVDAFIDWIM